MCGPYKSELKVNRCNKFGYDKLWNVLVMHLPMCFIYDIAACLLYSDALLTHSTYTDIHVNVVIQ